METAGKQVDDDELRDLMKENGIGRPSTRANIIETLFKRKYIKRNKKQILPTITGIQLIDTIQNNLLKSAELTGSWEKQLKDIEKGKYSAATFIKNMKRMVDALVYEVRSETKRANISHVVAEQQKPSKARKTKTDSIVNHTCPKCKQGKLLKGKKAYGCSRYKEGCDFVLPFKFLGKKISEKQMLRLIKKGQTIHLKGFKTEKGKEDGVLLFDEQWHLKLDSNNSTKKDVEAKTSNILTCPKCHLGTVIKGKTAYGCSHYKSGCDFNVTFETVRQKLNGQKPTKEMVMKILNEES